jgi:hypothetical protein
MYNYTNTMLAILVKLNLLTKEGAQEWSTKLGSEIHRADFQDALQTIDKVTDEVGDFLVEPWLKEAAKIHTFVDGLEKLVGDLELRIADLEKKLAIKK